MENGPGEGLTALVISCSVRVGWAVSSGRNVASVANLSQVRPRE
jgi:hypothetical protein